jgi:DNA-directed RNA polymerase sigma subunit (sigma70/sigma32)
MRTAVVAAVLVLVLAPGVYAANAGRMANSLDRLRTAAERARRLEAEEARNEYYDALSAARDEGQSLAALARELGITRQRVKQILNRPKP